MLSFNHDIKISFLKGGDIIKQIIVRLQDPIHQKLKIKTIQDDVSIQGLIESIIAEYLADDNLTAENLLLKIKRK